MSALFNHYQLGKVNLRNRIVMSPMTRSRCIGNIPNEILVTYYSQRAGAGLIITEGTAPSPNALGYANIPGIFNDAQTAAWKPVTEAVHEKEGKIFVQLMHTGRMGYLKNLPAGAELIAPSAIAAKGKAMKNSQRGNEYSVPRAMTIADIENTINEFVHASKNAMKAGFDGVELHGANEHIIEQFLSPHSNLRTDIYGGSNANRCRFALELTEAVGHAIGFDKVAIRLSPYGMNNEMNEEQMNDTYDILSSQFNEMQIAYIHHVDHSDMGGNAVPLSMKEKIRKNFKNTIILTGGFNKEKAEAAIEEGLADLIGFGRPFIGNPDLAERMEHNQPLNTALDIATFYTGGEKGYTDYQTFK